MNDVCFPKRLDSRFRGNDVKCQQNPSIVAKAVDCSMAFAADLWSGLACYRRLCLTASSCNPRFKSVGRSLSNSWSTMPLILSPIQGSESDCAMWINRSTSSMDCRSANPLSSILCSTNQGMPDTEGIWATKSTASGNSPGRFVAHSVIKTISVSLRGVGTPTKRFSQ